MKKTQSRFFPRASMADRRIRLSDDDAADRGEGKAVS